MEIKITEFVKNYLLTGNGSDFSCSQAERGSYSGMPAYNHAVETTEHFSVVNEESREAIIKYFKGFGAWDIEELNSMNDAELNGLCLQLIASEYKEYSFDAEEYCGNYCDASQSVDGEYYFYFGE
jgi:hypothetical protein